MDAPLQWRRVSRDRPCEICRKPDWCAFADGIALCMRVESPRPSRGDAGGWLHQLTEQRSRDRRRVLRLVANDDIDFLTLAERFADALTPDHRRALAAQLGVSEDALKATGAGRCQERNAWSWPMHDPQSRAVGIRLRDARTSAKYAVPGSKQGVFLAECPDRLLMAAQLLVTEGPTDLCAAYDLGYTAIGRPSCNGGTRCVTALTRGSEVVVVADTDEPGRRGAHALATALLPTVRGVRVVEPPAPHKDLRAWVQAGATREAVDALIEATPRQTIRMRFLR